MGKMREVCGAVSGMFLVAGILWGYDDVSNDDAKNAHYALVRELADRFREAHGTLICRELLEHLKVSSGGNAEERTPEYYRVRPCARFVRTAAEILAARLERD